MWVDNRTISLLLVSFLRIFVGIIVSNFQAHEHMRKLLLISLSLCVIAMPTICQQQWTLIPSTAGYFIYDMDIYCPDPDTLVAAGDRFLRSVDDGQTWDTLARTGGYAIKISQIHSNVMYASFRGGLGPKVGVTTDGGETWKFISSIDGPVWSFVTINPHKDSIAFASMSPGFIVRTTDQGATWTILDSLGHVGPTSLAIDPANDSIVYVGALLGIYKSTDMGATWRRLESSPWSGYEIHLAINPKDHLEMYASVYSFGSSPGGVYKSSDGGDSWMEINNGLPGNEWRINSIAINPSSTTELFIGTTAPHPLFQSTDAGTSWIEFHSGISDSSDVSVIDVDTLHRRIFAGVNTIQSRRAGIYVLATSSWIDEPDEVLPTRFSLSQNYPNPFNPATHITFLIAQTTEVIVKVFDVLGNEVATLVQEKRTPGSYDVVWNAEGLASGLYFCRMTAVGFAKSKKMILLR